LIAVIFYKRAEGGRTIDIDAEHLSDLSVYGISANLGLLLMMLPFVASLIVLALVIKSQHKRSMAETINGTRSIRWGRFFFAALVWASLSAIYLLIDYCINPGDFQFSFNISSFIPLVLISIIFIPLQASFEEVLCRGYLAQGVAAWTRSRWLAIIIPTLLFALGHSSNPEVTEYGFLLAMSQYALLGLVLGLISTLDDGIETALGAHSANNVFASIFLTYKSSVLPTPALFNQLRVDPVRELWSLAIVCVVFVTILGYKYKWKLATLNKKVVYPTDGAEAAFDAPLT
jgi:membrane protease YdiL (CAAX protease family)